MYEQHVIDRSELKVRHIAAVTCCRAEVKADPHMLLLLRVYTVDVDTRELVVIGSCFYELFDRNQVGRNA